MSIVLCQQKKWGSCCLFKVFVCKDCIENSLHARTITEGPHGPASPSDFPESPLNRIGGS